MNKLLLIICALCLSVNIFADKENNEYTIDGEGNVVFTHILENLSMSKQEIYDAAYKYISTAYRDTKYRIIKNSAEDGIVAGEGEFVHFHEANYYPSSYFLNAPIILRVDNKDGRARLSAIVSHYTGTRTNINKREEIRDRVSQCPPIAKGDKSEKLYDRRKKLYEKAFVVLSEKVKKTLNEFANSLKASRSAATNDDW
ncbi:MAG: DUF4468 domain-containing protein [Prevotellaceae bacterium]|nr:DUF4468 domain-containing protein [Prevotellaceae bacterium]